MLENLIGRTVTGGTSPGTQHYVFDGTNMVLAFDGNDNLTDRYLSGPAVDQVLADEHFSWSSGSNQLPGPTTPFSTLWALGDNQNTVRDVVTDAGVSAEHTAYNPFGEALPSTGTGAMSYVNPTYETALADMTFGYTGTYTDPLTGLQLHGVRWYNPASQRWLTQDPLGLAADTNPYRYCGNAPTIYVDPSGLADHGINIDGSTTSGWGYGNANFDGTHVYYDSSEQWQSLSDKEKDAGGTLWGSIKRNLDGVFSDLKRFVREAMDAFYEEAKHKGSFSREARRDLLKTSLSSVRLTVRGEAKVTFDSTSLIKSIVVSGNIGLTGDVKIPTPWGIQVVVGLTAVGGAQLKGFCKPSPDQGFSANITVTPNAGFRVGIPTTYFAEAFVEGGVYGSYQWSTATVDKSHQQYGAGFYIRVVADSQLLADTKIWKNRRQVKYTWGVGAAPTVGD